MHAMQSQMDEGMFPEAAMRYGASLVACGPALYLFGGADMARRPPPGRVPAVGARMRAFGALVQYTPGTAVGGRDCPRGFGATRKLPMSAHAASWSFSMFSLSRALEPYIAS